MKDVEIEKSRLFEIFMEKNEHKYLLKIQQTLLKHILWAKHHVKQGEVYKNR